MATAKLFLSGARRHVVAIVLVLGTVLSLGTALRVQTVEGEKRQADLNQRATAAVTALQRSVQGHVDILYNIGALYAASAAVKRTEFREFTQGLLKRYPVVQALGWIPRVAEADRETYGTAARQDRLADFQMTERTPQGQVIRAARRDVYYPVFYVEPLASNLALLGFNLSSDPTHFETLQKALSTGEVTASPWINVAQDTSEQFGFFLFLPIYKNGMPHGTLEERRASLQGFVLAVIRLGILVERSLKGLAVGHMDLHLTDVTDAASRHMLYLQSRMSQTPLLAFALRQSAETERIRANVHWEAAFPVAGRRWSALVSPPPKALGALPWQVWGLFIGGLVFTVLLAKSLHQRSA